MSAVSWLKWALFENDEDGPYGVYPETPWGAIRWWFRNPLHNLFWHVLNWPGGPFWGFGPGIDPDATYPGWNGYIGWRPQRDGNGVFGIALRYETGANTL